MTPPPPPHSRGLILSRLGFGKAIAHRNAVKRIDQARKETVAAIYPTLALTTLFSSRS
jgi:hypothetical protein